MSHPVNELDSGRWANRNPARCECRNGWLHSDWDTWHRCPLHGKGVPHPEDEGGEFDYQAHSLRIYREAYASFRDEAVALGMTRGEFRLTVEKILQTGVPTMSDWVNAADDVACQAFAEDADRRAEAQGYSCRLEAAWAADGAFERACREHNVEPETEAYGPLTAERDSWYRQ
jgi:hypothetical protein